MAVDDFPAACQRASLPAAAGRLRSGLRSSTAATCMPWAWVPTFRCTYATRKADPGCSAPGPQDTTLVLGPADVKGYMLQLLKALDACHKRWGGGSASGEARQLLMWLELRTPLFPISQLGPASRREAQQLPHRC
jgi:hypothetical protein